MNNRNLIIGTVVAVVVVAAAYFMWSGEDETPTSPTPPAATQPKT
jgi:hypothetical protein